jgi:hypothetical protein
MASGTGNSFVGTPFSANNSSILSAAYPHGIPGGMNSHISSIESVGSTPTAVPYTFSLMGGRRRSRGRRTGRKSKSIHRRSSMRKCSTRIRGRGRGRSSRYRRYAR